MNSPSFYSAINNDDECIFRISMFNSIKVIYFTFSKNVSICVCGGPRIVNANISYLVYSTIENRPTFNS